MHVARIIEILEDCLSKTDENGRPAPSNEVVDVWVEFTLNADKAREYESEMVELLKAWPSESWGVTVPRLGEEINYLIAGSVLRGQYRAFLLFAYGKLLGWWTILDPRTMLGMDKHNELAQEMAHSGLVSVFGYQPNISQ